MPNEITLKEKIVKSITKPPRVTYCPPFLTQGTCTMIYAPRGIGKSHYAFNMALAIVKGSNWLGERCTKGRVMYVDGEMGADAWINRLPRNQVFPKDVSENICLLNPEDYKLNMVPSMADPVMRSYWIELLEPYDVVIIDNYLTTVYPKNNKDSDLSLWYEFLKLLLTLKTKGKAIVIIHHTAKSGVQYGSVLKENQMNTIIRLRQFPEQCLSNGLTWEVKVEKDRDNAFVKETEFGMDIVFTDAEVFTTKRSIREMRKNLIEDYQRKGLSRGEIAQALSVDSYQIAEFIKRNNNEEKKEDWI